MKTKHFYTRLLPKHVCGADYIYQFFSVNSDVKLGMIDGKTGQICFQDSNWLLPQELKSLVTLVAKIVNHCNK